MTTDQQRLADHKAQVGWFGDIPEGHYAIPDLHNPEVVSMWRVRRGHLQEWPKEALNGPQVRAFKRDIPRDRVERAAFWARLRAARRAYLDEVEAVLGRAPEEAAARYAATTFRCAICNRPLKVPESNGYGLGPECRSWMPPALLAAYAAQVAHVRAEIGGAA